LVLRDRLIDQHRTYTGSTSGIHLGLFSGSQLKEADLHPAKAVTSKRVSAIQNLALLKQVSRSTSIKRAGLSYSLKHPIVLQSNQIRL